MKPTARELVAIARAHVGEFTLSKPACTAASVAAALVTPAGNVYTGVCFDVASGMGTCAEHAAVAAMLQGRETVVARIVAVTARGIVPPCGRCRELLSQVDGRNLQCEVVIGADKSVTLEALLPVRDGEAPFDDGPS